MPEINDLFKMMAELAHKALLAYKEQDREKHERLTHIIDLIEEELKERKKNK